MRLRHHLARCSFLALLWLPGLSELVAAPAATNHWAFQPLAPQTVPTAKGSSRVRNPVDAFVLARLENAGLSLSPTAPSPALLRRLSFDLTGLPPVAATPSDSPPRSYDSHLAALLASPAFGERWARWWLDAAGYVDTVTLDNDPNNLKVAHDKWRYRDYVIASFNEDKPFNQFLREQLAGDTLSDWRDVEVLGEPARMQLIATGFLRAAPDETEIDETNTPDVHHALLQETAEVVAANLLGLTFNCARCHDHKYEPVTQRDYFSFLAHFAPAFNPQAWLRPKERVLTDVPKSARPALAKQNAALDAEVDALKKQQQAIRDRYRDELLEARLPRVPEAIRAEAKLAARTPFEQRTEDQRRLVGRFERLLRVSLEEAKAALRPPDKAEWERLDKEIAAVNARRPQPPQIHVVFDTDKPAAVHILRRGEFDKPAESVQPALPAVLSLVHALPSLSPTGGEGRGEGAKRSNIITSDRTSGSPPHPNPLLRWGRGNPSNGDWPTNGTTNSHRLALAQQLTDPDSRAAALVARVLMNRVWQQLFGQGLVATSANLGVSGARPTHPELLDWLAGEFIRNGWRLKPMIRLIVTSSTYQQSSSAAADPALAARARQADPENDLLWHQRLRRLESEMIRDALLATSGELDERVGGPPVLTEMRPDGAVSVATNKLAQTGEAFRRSLYLLQRRTYHPSLLAAFDQPLLNANCVQRTTSATVGQSLALLNDGFVNDRASALARLVCAAQPDTASRVDLAFRLVLARPPRAEESSWCLALAEREGVRLLTNRATLESAREAALARVCHTLLNTSEFLCIP
jgi:hypothetical protein